MTYCVSLRVKAGLVMLADTRTNAGLDDISRLRKLFTYDVPGERVLGVMMSGNLSITQGVHSILSRAIRNSADDPGVETISNCDSMFRAAQIVGEAMNARHERYRQTMDTHGSADDASIVVSGEYQGEETRQIII